MILADKRGMRTFELIEGLREIALRGIGDRIESIHVNEICDELRIRVGIEKLQATRLPKKVLDNEQQRTLNKT